MLKISLTSRIACALLLLSLAPFARADDGDAPYVMRDAAGALEAWNVEATPQGLRKQVRSLPAGATLTVAAVGEVPAFTVKLRPPADLAAGRIKTGKSAALFVVADTHGEYEILAAMLMKHQVVDGRLHWSFGRGHLVILGDVFDRGAHQTEILWLIYALEAEARKAGGGVDFVLGNHEVMELRADLRYLNPKYRQVAEALGVASYSQLFGANSVLGQWLRTRPTVLQVNGLLCLHGGISPQLLERNLTLADINAAVRGVLEERAFADDAARERAGFLLGESGPLWYRGYFPAAGGAALATATDVDRILEHFGVERILVGHTMVPTITPLYAGKVIAVQVYPRRDAAGRIIFEALLVRGGSLQRARPDGGLEPL